MGPQIKKLQIKDEEIKEMIELVKKNRLPGYELDNGVLLKIRKGKIIKFSNS